MVMSANSKSPGSMCQLHGWFTPPSPRATRPLGICGACLPASSRRAMVIWAGSMIKTRYCSSPTWNVAIMSPLGVADGTPPLGVAAGETVAADVAVGLGSWLTVGARLGLGLADGLGDETGERVGLGVG